jgi:hypothetical protein
VIRAEAQTDDCALVDLFCQWITDGFETPDFKMLVADRSKGCKATAAGAGGQQGLATAAAASLKLGPM